MFLVITLKVLWVNQQRTMSKKVISSNADTAKYVCNLFSIIILLTSHYRDLLKATVVLLPLLGLTWIIGIIAVNNETQAFAWIFAVLNSLQVHNFYVSLYYHHYILREFSYLYFMC